jgi:hypothetical protein
MAAPGSELATRRWLRERSALGELLGVDFETLPSMRLYRTSDLLVRHRDRIEDALFARVQDLFGLPVTVTLYDLTNTYFEGTAAGNAKAARGRSKEKRPDCPLVTLGLVLDASGPRVKPEGMLRAPLPDVRRQCRGGQYASGHAQGTRHTARSAGHHGRPALAQAQDAVVSPPKPTSSGSNSRGTTTSWSAASVSGSSTRTRPPTR